MNDCADHKVRLGISTCPNDTFAFHALLNRLVDWRGLEFEVDLLDIQQLNDRLFRDEFDVAKASFHAAVLLSDRIYVLPSGSALGFGVGPLLLSAQPGETSPPRDPSQLTLCPGQHTTASLLFELFYPQTTRVQQVVFSEIMPRLRHRRADFGVCIHEGRFTWQQQGLGCVEDLGTRWEETTNCPLPLGGIIADRQIAAAKLATIQAVIRDSLQFSLDDPRSALPTMRRFAQEFDDNVLQQHVSLYVNEWTIELGDVGARALQELSRRAKSLGLLAASQRDLEVFR